VEVLRAALVYAEATGHTRGVDVRAEEDELPSMASTFIFVMSLRIMVRGMAGLP